MENPMTYDSFDFGDTATIACSGEIGRVIGKATYPNREDQYLIRYCAGDGRAQECWWDASALHVGATSAATRIAEPGCSSMQAASSVRGPRLSEFKVEGAMLDLERAPNGGWVVYDSTTRNAFGNATKMIGSFTTASELIRALEVALASEEAQPA